MHSKIEAAIKVLTAALHRRQSINVEAEQLLRAQLRLAEESDKAEHDLEVARANLEELLVRR